MPFDTDFNIYCVGPCGEMVVFTDYLNVYETASLGQLVPDLALLALVITSGGGVSTDTARIFVDVTVPSSWTLESTFILRDLPSDFSSLPLRHIFVGNSDRQGSCAGLFFSKVGIAYTGSVRHDGGNNLVLNGGLQILPDSLNLVPEDVRYTLRLVVSHDTGTTYIYLTETSQVPLVGHQLRYILPSIPSASQVVLPQDGTVISVRGTVSEPSSLELDVLCLGQGLLIPNLPPVADAGVDQAARACSIVRLDGRRSYDPEGANLTYQWRLIDAPLTSVVTLKGDDGWTPTPTQTNKLYSAEATGFIAEPGIAPGDVLLLDGTPHTIVTTGSDLNGFYIQVEGYVLDPGLTGKSFRIFKQNTLSGPTTAQPTFYPDVPGIYRFDLTVYDGSLHSTSSGTIVNVTESPVPRGCTPDVGFLWNYLSDFWRLVEGTEVIDTFWGAMAQIAASELLSLWQHEYSKSLRDVQRTFQRRWLHYDLFVQEPLVEETTVRTLFAGVQSKSLTLAAGVSVGGTTIVVQLPDGTTHEHFLTQPEGAAATVVASLRDRLQRWLVTLDPRFTVDLVVSLDGLTGRLVLRAPFPFVLTSASTATALFTFPAANDLPRGSGGAVVGVNSYRLDRPLTGVDVKGGDYLVLGGTAYRILRVVTDTSDPWGDQRVVLSDNLPLSASADWVIAGSTRSTFLDFYSALCSAGDVAIYEVIEKATGAIAYVATDVLSAASDGNSSLLTEHGPIAPYLTDAAYDVYFHSVYRRTYMPVDPLVVEIPTLQEKIKNTNDQEVLRQNIDFFRTEFRGKPCIQFVTGAEDVWQRELPPKRIWAETTYIDNRPVIEQNFGIPAEFTVEDLSQLPANVDYLSVVRGLWYAYFNGPTVHNLRVGTQILLGLPFAEEAGTLVEIDVDFSPNQGRILVQDNNEQAIVRSYTYPRVLPLEVNPDTQKAYAVGDTVAQFAPLVQGVEVTDYVKDPRWFEGMLNQGSFYEVEKFFKFLVRIDSAAFNLNTLLFAHQFVQRVKPTYTFPVLAVRKAVNETTVDTNDTIVFSGALELHAGIYPGHFGQAQMWDQPHPSRGGWWNQFDTQDPYNPPTYPTPQTMSEWAFDQSLLAPAEALLAKLSTTFGVATLPTTDSIFYTGVPIYTTIVGVIEHGQRFWVPTAGFPVGAVTSTVTTTINKVYVFLRMIAENNTPLTLTLKKNNVTVLTHSFTTPLTGTGLDAAAIQMNLNAAIGVVPGDVLTATFAHDTTDYNTYLEALSVVLGDGQDWTMGVPVGPGTFTTVLPL